MQHAWIWKYRGLGNGIRCAAMAIVLLCMVCSCDRPIRNQSLKTFYEQLSEKNLTAEKASDIRLSLENISTDSLNEAECKFRSFLIIKASDKAYIPHSNDTAYLAVKDYFSKHHEELYPEVLYYGGRVYSDIGDYPTALQYFNEALEKLDDSEKNLDLRATINSQTGRLLNEIRVYDQALDFLNEAIRIGEQLRDTIGVVYDLQLAGAISLRAERIDKARGYILKAQSMSERLSPDFIATNNMYLARAACKQGDLTNARMHIQRALPYVDSITLNEAYAVGAEIYHRSGNNDSAYIFAKRIADGEDNLCKHIAYYFLVYKLSDYIPTDSLPSYLQRYHVSLEKSLNVNENEASLMQTSLYNYKVHDRKRMEAELKQRQLFYWIIGITLSAMFIIIVLITIKYRQQRTINEIREQLDNIRILRERLSADTSHTLNSPDSNEKTFNQEENEATEASLRERLRKECMELYHDKVKNADIGAANAIIVSPVYKKILERIERNSMISDTDPLWIDLEKMILEASPRFIDNLRLLMGGKVTKTELHTAFLIKCGIRLSHMALLFSRTDSSIASRRDTISKKAFGCKLEPKVIDGIIRLL